MQERYPRDAAEILDLLEETRWYLCATLDSLDESQRESLFARTGLNELAAAIRTDRVLRGCVSAGRAMRSSIRALALMFGVTPEVVAGHGLTALVAELTARSDHALADELRRDIYRFHHAGWWAGIAEERAGSWPRRGIPAVETYATPSLHRASAEAAAELAFCAQLRVAHGLRETHAVCRHIEGAATELLNRRSGGVPVVAPPAVATSR